MENKICLVTGANAGIGYETAKGLAARGARVLMVCRDMVKGEAAKAEIVAATGNIYSGLWYPIIVAGAGLIIGMLLLPETRDRKLD